MTTDAARPRSRGRPRSEVVDEAIVDAAVRCLAADGYDGLTFSAVAERAHVGRPAIYRRYESRAELAVAALMRLSQQHPVTLPDDARGAARELLGATATALRGPGAMTILGSMLAQEQRDPELSDTFRQAVFAPRHAVVRDVISAGIRRGQVRADADIDTVIDMLFGSLLARALWGASLDEAFLDRVVDTTWAAIGTERP